MNTKITAEEHAAIDALVSGPRPVPGVVTAAELGEWLNLAAPRVSALAREGRIPRRADGRFDLQAAIRGYVESLRLKSGSSALASNPELNAEKIRLARANAEKVEAANARARGELAALSDVEREWAGILRDVRAALLALPSRAAARLGHLTPHDVATLDREVRAVLEELATDE
jgi:phage terminase Nu1 subunit (DNA packaging protein)